MELERIEINLIGIEKKELQWIGIERMELTPSPGAHGPAFLVWSLIQKECIDFEN